VLVITLWLFQTKVVLLKELAFKMISVSLSGKCGTYCSWVTSGLLCKNCNCYFHIHCVSISPSMQWGCMFLSTRSMQGRKNKVPGIRVNGRKGN
jgi:hypothetical protein